MFNFLTNTTLVFKTILVFCVLLGGTSLWGLSKYKKYKQAKAIKEKQVAEHEALVEDTLKNVEVLNESRKDELEVLDYTEALDKAGDDPTDEDLEAIREKIKRDYKKGFPQ